MRLIDADDLRERINELLGNYLNGEKKLKKKLDIGYSIGLIDALSAIGQSNVVQIKDHGHWVETKNPDLGRDVYCSQCFNLGRTVFRFCPRCGAIMDEKDKYETD